MDGSIDETLALFVADSTQQLDVLEGQLLALERDPADHAALDALFRAAHTIKGNAAVVQLGEVEWFAHVTESVLERLRSGELLAGCELITLLLACSDHLRYLVTNASFGADASPAFAEEDRARLIGLLVPWLGDELEEVAPHSDATPRRSEEDCWRISLQPGFESLRQGLDPLNFLRHLETLGRLHSLRVVDDEIPPSEGFDPEACYLRFEVLLDTGADKQAIEDVFSFMRDACTLQIEPPASQLDDWVDRLDSLPEDELQTGEMLVRVGALTPDELASGLRAQRGGEGSGPIGRILVDEGFVPPQVVDAALRRQDEIKTALQREAAQLRVSAERLDQLVNSLAGMQGSLAQLAQRGTRVSAVEMVALQHALEKARRLAEGLRMARFGEQFRRFHRLVRDASLELGKRADLLVSGGEVEMDRAVADALGDVLMHLLRNAIDHGIEAPDVRQAAGKPAHGSLSVSIKPQADWVLLRVSDDGAGVDLARVRAAAEARGLLTADQLADEVSLLAQLFAPGFSTAERLSHYSGRGVGLDAVRAAIHALGGEIKLQSRSGQGCCFEIRVPAAPPQSALPALHAAA